MIQLPELLGGNVMISKKEAWKPDNWFVSPWNFLEEVTGGFHSPEKVKIHDVTLRDGEQQAGIIFRKDDKIRIAEKLAESGVQRIEAGTPAVSPHDEAAIRESSLCVKEKASLHSIHSLQRHGNNGIIVQVSVKVYEHGNLY